MQKIVKGKFDKQQVEQFRNDFQDAVKHLEKIYGVHISLGTLTYDGGEVRGKMTATKGEKMIKPTINEFKIGDIVSINHKTINPNNRYEIVKINKKTLKVKNLNNIFNIVKVSAGLLAQAESLPAGDSKLQGIIDKF